MEFGRDPGPKCPECRGLVRAYRPHKRVVAVSSFLLSILTMEFVGVRSVLWFVLGAATLWIPFALGLNILIQRAQPFKLEAVNSRRFRRDPISRLFK